MKISAIIPCYNDNQYIQEIINIVYLSKICDEIIVIDDGSDIKTKEKLQNLKHIKLITHQNNLGKSIALKSGLSVAKHQIILFLDADLIGLKPFHLIQLSQPVLTKKYDVCIGKFIDKFHLFSRIGQTTMLSGIRCCRRNIFNKNPQILDNTGFIGGYLVEVKCNQIIFNSHYQIFVVTLEGLTQKYKWQKGYFLSGAVNDIKVILNILRYLGPREYLHQLFFCQKLSHSC